MHRVIDLVQVEDEHGRLVLAPGVDGAPPQITFAELVQVHAHYLETALVDLVEAHENIKAGQQDQRQHDPDRVQPLPFRVTDVVDVDARADDPAPGLETFHIGQLFHGLVASGFGPHVVDEALAVTGSHRHEGLEQCQAVGVLDIADVLAVELRLDRVHHNHRLHVVDPEVLVLAVTQLADCAFRQLLRLFARQLAGRFLALCPGYHAVGDLHMFTRRVHAVFHHGIGLAFQHPAQHQQRRDQESQRDDRGLGLEIQAAHQHHPGGPDAMCADRVGCRLGVGGMHAYC